MKLFDPNRLTPNRRTIVLQEGLGLIISSSISPSISLCSSNLNVFRESITDPRCAKVRWIAVCFLKIGTRYRWLLFVTVFKSHLVTKAIKVSCGCPVHCLEETNSLHTHHPVA